MTIQVKGTFSATGVSAAFSPRADLSQSGFNMMGFGTFVASVRLERSFDNGANWLPLTTNGAAAASWTANWNERQVETEQSVMYRYNCFAYTSGTVSYYLSQ